MSDTTKPTPLPKKEAVFSAAQFRSHAEGKFWTAEDKAKWANAFVRFVRSGFDERLYDRAMYHGLHQHMGFIAHYDKDGFWSERFGTPAAVIETVDLMLSGVHGFGGLSEWTWSDVKRAVARWLTKECVLGKLTEQAADRRRIAELAERDRLVAKYGPPAAA